MSCWYSLDNPRWVLSFEYPFARVSVIFQFFLQHFVLAKLATSSIRVNIYKLEWVNVCGPRVCPSIWRHCVVPQPPPPWPCVHRLGLKSRASQTNTIPHTTNHLKAAPSIKSPEEIHYLPLSCQQHLLLLSPWWPPPTSVVAMDAWTMCACGVDKIQGLTSPPQPRKIRFDTLLLASSHLAIVACLPELVFIR